MRDEIFRGNDICLYNNGVEKLSHVDIYLLRGELLCVCGTFHSGIQYLEQVLMGDTRAAKGEFFIEGKKTKLWGGRSYIGRINKDSYLVENMSIGENLYVIYKKRPVFVKWKTMYQYINSLLSAMFPYLKAECRVSKLSFVEKKIVEIIKLLLMGVQMIVIDNDICYTEKANAALYEAVHKFTQKGISFIYFGNKPNYFFEKADRIMVFRNRHVVGHIVEKKKNMEQILCMMAANFEAPDNLNPEKGTAGKGKIFFQIFIDAALQNKKINIYENEIVGFWCLEKNTLNTLNDLFIKASQRKQPVNGLIFDIPWRIEWKNNYRLALIPYDYTGDLICRDLSVYDNIYLNMAAGTLRTKLSFFLKTNSYFSKEVDKVFGRESGWSVSHKANRLTHQEQRKILVYRSLIGKPKLLLFSFPTKGIDQIIQTVKKKKMPAIILTDSIEEMIGVCEKIYCINEGKIRNIIIKNEYR